MILVITCGKSLDRDELESKGGLTNGTSTPIKSRTVGNPCSLTTFSSGIDVPSVKLRKRSNSILGLSTSYPCTESLSARSSASRKIQRRARSESIAAGLDVLVMRAAQRCGRAVEARPETVVRRGNAQSSVFAILLLPSGGQLASTVEQ